MGEWSKIEKGPERTLLPVSWGHMYSLSLPSVRYREKTTGNEMNLGISANF
jgi:hypothetical protein